MKKFQSSILIFITFIFPLQAFSQTAIDFSLQQSMKNKYRQHQNVPKKSPKKTFKPYYFMVYGGYGVPYGSVSDIGGLVEFPSVSSNIIYKSGFAFGLMVGAEKSGWIFEISLEGRDPLPLTSTGQELANLSRTDNRKVDVGYFAFSLFLGKSFKLGHRMRTSLGIYNSLIDNQLRAGEGEQPHDHEGYGMAARLGIDLLPIRSWDLIVRLGAKYQLLSIGISIPNDLVYHLGLGWGFEFWFN